VTHHSIHHTTKNNTGQNIKPQYFAVPLTIPDSSSAANLKQRSRRPVTRTENRGRHENSSGVLAIAVMAIEDRPTQQQSVDDAEYLPTPRKNAIRGRTHATRKVAGALERHRHPL
jgi:hypothetical protein